MAILTVTKLTKTYAKTDILTDVTFSVERGDKLGFVGANGSGKTTVLRIIAGETAPDTGETTLGRGVTCAYMPQDVCVDTRMTLRAYVREARADVPAMEAELRRIEEELVLRPGDAGLLARVGALNEQIASRDGWRLESECERVLAGLGFAPGMFDAPLAAMSGGEQTKAALARILIEAPDLMLLDEPTNHLDIWATLWLESYLVRTPSAALIVSHDRYFLDRVATGIVELAHGRTESYRGNWSAYMQDRERRRLTHERTFQKQQVHIAREEDFIRRYHYGQRAREARGRRKKLDRLQRLEKLRGARTLAVKLESARDKGNKIVRLRGVAKRFGDRELFREADIEIARGERVGLIGPNGAGKTTFLRVLVGEEPPTEGVVERGAVSVGYYDQHQRSLHPGDTVLESLARVRPEMTVGELRGAAGRFLFSGDDVIKRVAALSGGERARLALAGLVLSAPSFLVLDEPTNHLDIPSREAVENALADFDGTVLIVTHDRCLLDAVVDTLLVFRDGRVRVFHGDFTDWSEDAAREDAARRQRAAAGDAPGDSETFRRRAKDRERLLRRHARALEDIHARIETLEARRAAIHREFETPQAYENPARIKELAAQAQALDAQIEAAYARWQELEDRKP